MKEERTNIVEKIVEAYHKYAPKNITLEQFIDMVGKDHDLMRDIERGTLGEFSTFNPKLARLYKELDTEDTESKDSFRNKLKDSLDTIATEKRVKDIAKIYEEIICSDDDILQAAWTFDTLNENQKQDLAIKIIDGINQHFEIKDKIKVSYRKDLFKKSILKFVVKLLGIMEHKKYEFINYGGLYGKRKITIIPVSNFLGFIGIISHEYGHFIDDNYPNLGMLGAQFAAYGRSVYSSIEGDEIYKSNPTEISSFKIEDAVSEHIRKVLEEQTIKKPELYIESLNICISYWRVKFAGVDLKYKKIIKSIDDAKEQMHKTREMMVRRLYPDQDIENMDVVKLVNMVEEANKTKEVKEATEKYHNLAQKAEAKEYKDTKDKLEHYELTKKSYIKKLQKTDFARE